MSGYTPLNASQLDQYLDAIGIGREPCSRAALDRMLAAHVSTLPFASVSPILGLPMSLQPADILERLVDQRVGGYCFEHNGLLHAVLQALGYDVNPILARVIYHLDDPFAQTALTHRSNVVTIDGERWLFDGGFSFMSPGYCVRLDSDAASDDGRFRVTEAIPGDWHYQCMRPHGFHSMYRFKLGEVGPADFELGHYWSSTHPEAIFTNHLVASLIYPDRTVSVRNTMLVIEPRQGRGDITEITSADQLRDILREQIGISVTHAQTDTLFARAVKASSAGSTRIGE